MAATRDDTTFVETPTDYETHSLDNEHVIELHIGGVERRPATTIAQQLSLFVETHDPHVLLRLLDALEFGVDDTDELAVGIGTPAAGPECARPIELEVEDIKHDEAEAIVDTFDQLVAARFADEDAAESFLKAVEAATGDQPRSIVRLVKNDGSRRDALEWHTDTDAEFETT
ncbi:hypothetical protein [Haloarcula marismortui]|uniref:Uncharacterized protein n=1 Tax=Haloarcula marismortui ATCC 33800 TaxID=662476 RepID=M0JAN1_9EURY|nr:hypothetical protein [Haloarcula sinaiiensis]EMA06177.1 hypothetical protein C436_21810 [Haloarcula sinaiiensis ATCC 33800]QUJ74768.1 hypothetical protein KDQ40_21835 [Haloarcula sinaiiensis ATCC 33800]